MPLDTQNRQMRMYKGLRHAVRSALDDNQPLARLCDALVMGAVDREAFSIQGMENASLLRICEVYLIPSNKGMLPGGRKILDDAAFETDVDQLHALTDAEHRDSFLQKRPQEKKLKPVQFRIDGAGTPIFLLKKKRIDIAAAGKNEGVELGGETGQEGAFGPGCIGMYSGRGQRVAGVRRHAMRQRLAVGAKGGECREIV